MRLSCRKAKVCRIHEMTPSNQLCRFLCFRNLSDSLLGGDENAALVLLDEGVDCQDDGCCSEFRT